MAQEIITMNISFYTSLKGVTNGFYISYCISDPTLIDIDCCFAFIVPPPPKKKETKKRKSQDPPAYSYNKPELN